MNIMKWREGREPAEPRGIVLRDTVRYTAIVDGWERAWEVYIPKAYTGEKKVPAIFCVHGAGGFSTAKTAWPLIAERENILLVYPEAKEPWLWNIWGVKTKDGAPDDVAFLDYLVDWVQKKYMVDKSRIYMQGNSMGDNMVSTYAYEHGNRLAAIAPTSGPTLPSVQCNEKGEFVISPKYPLPVVRLHGDRDSKCGFPSTYGISKYKFEKDVTLEEQWKLRAMMDQMQKDQWNQVNQANHIPELYFTDYYNLEIYRGEYAELYYYSVVEGEHSPDLDFYEIIWGHCFSGWRRAGGISVRTGAEEPPAQDLAASALAEGTDWIYTGGKIKKINGEQQPECINHIWYVPVELLPVLVQGLKIEGDMTEQHELTLLYKQVKVEIAEGECCILVNGRVVSIPLIRRRGEKMMIPFAELAEKSLGLCTDSKDGVLYVTDHSVKLTKDGVRIILELLNLRERLRGDISFERELRDRIIKDTEEV